MAAQVATSPSSIDHLGPARHGTAVTPSDTADLTVASRGLIVGSSGNVQVTFVGGETVVLPSLAAGVLHAIAASRIWSTNTTAATIVAVW